MHRGSISKNSKTGKNKLIDMMLNDLKDLNDLNGREILKLSAGSLRREERHRVLCAGLQNLIF